MSLLHAHVSHLHRASVRVGTTQRAAAVAGGVCLPAAKEPVARVWQCAARRRHRSSSGRCGVAVAAVASQSSVASPKAMEEPCFSQPGYRRPLHWVFKVGDLKATLDFYARTLGLKVHRHEEFASGCEATCNGPFGGAWSKTMVGVGSESTHFALELTYNYGISAYARGNDLRHIAVRRAAVKDASAVTVDAATGRQMMTSPDGYPFLVVDAPPLAGSPPDEPFLFVSLHVSDLDAVVAFYRDVLKATVLDAASVPGGERAAKAAHVRFAPNTPGVELVQLPAGVALDRGVATGRFATETEDGAPERVAAGVTAYGKGTCVLHGPLKLQPHGEEVAIVQDKDGHEYCFVDARGYRTCIAVAQRDGGTKVDWAYRDRLAQAAALTGEAAKTGVAAVLAGDYDVAAVAAKLDGLVASAPVVVFSQTSCPFCKKAKALLGDTLGVKAPKLKVLECDTLGAEGYALRVELAKRTGRSSVPNIFVGGTSVGGFSDGPGVNTLHEQGKLQDMLRKAGAL